MNKLQKWFNNKLLHYYPKKYWDGKYCENCGEKVLGRFGVFCSNECYEIVYPPKELKQYDNR